MMFGKWDVVFVAVFVVFLMFIGYLTSRENIANAKIDACNKLPSQLVGKCLADLK